jgi:SAM-dependent methyltransferase
MILADNSIRLFAARLMNKEQLVCSVCGGACALLDVMDFNKPCLEEVGASLGVSGIPVYYALCGACGFCFAPELYQWSLEEFEARIYNADYARLDPDYKEVRPRNNAAYLRAMFPDRSVAIRHLDYGGGNGYMAELLRQAGWNSRSYDPLADRGVTVSALGRFDLITAYEVFEHVPDVQALMSSLGELLAPNGLVLFSTLLSDGHIQSGRRINWWYASPRNGHISLFSRNSLATLARAHGLHFHSFSTGFHALFTEVPAWAGHLLRVPGGNRGQPTAPPS